MTAWKETALAMERLNLEMEAAVATQILLEGGDVDEYLERVRYAERLAAFRAAGGSLR